MSSNSFFERPAIGWWIAVIGGLAMFEVTTFQPDSFPFQVLGPLAEPIKYLSYHQSIWMQVGFAAAILAHVGEGIAAYSLAKKLKLSTAAHWGIQTLVLGFPSYRLLLGYERSLAGRKRS